MSENYEDQLEIWVSIVIFVNFLLPQFKSYPISNLNLFHEFKIFHSKSLLPGLIIWIYLNTKI